MSALLLSILLLSDSAPTLPTPQWKVGQEYLYRGSVKETGQAQDIQLLNQYHLELRVLVLGIKGSTAEVICCTKLVQQGISKIEQALSVHLVRAVIDLRGKVTSCSAPSGMGLIIDGPATWENGFLLPLGTETLKPGQTWEVAEPGRLPRKFTWTVSGESTTSNIINGEQQSIDWERPRADSTAWRRTDKLTFTPKATLPTRVQRTIERRAPAHRQVTTRIITEYELVRQEVLAGPLLDERVRDIQQIKLFQEEVNTLSSQLHDARARQAWQRLAKRLEDYQKSSGNSPYRETLVTLLSTVQAGLENRLTQAKYEVPERSIQVGQLTPHFTLLTTNGQTITSTQCRGKPCLLVFLQPGSELTKTLSFEIPTWQQRYGASTFGCLLLSSTDASDKLPPIVERPGTVLKNANGRPLVATYGITTTPQFILLDADGALLSVYEGWGPEVRTELDKKIRQELDKSRR